jgi:hypothetical protein
MVEIKSRYEAERMIVDKAFEDDEFKKELIANPKSVLQKEFGSELPADLDVQVLEITKEKTYFVLPVKPPAGVEIPKESDAQPGADSIIAKAWNDEAFKKSFLDDPKATLNSVFHADLPANLQVEALEETPNKLYITLPSEKPPDELSDEQLESVAGGECVVTTTCVIGGLIIGACVFGQGICLGVSIEGGRRLGW